MDIIRKDFIVPEMDAPNPYSKDEEGGVTKDKAHLSASGLQLFIKIKAFLEKLRLISNQLYLIKNMQNQ